VDDEITVTGGGKPPVLFCPNPVQFMKISLFQQTYLCYTTSDYVKEQKSEK